MTELAPLTVFYNTKCPVCDGGINWQRNRLIRAAQDGVIIFRDINETPGALAAYGADVNDVRRRLHGVTPDGALFVGADCAVEIWRRTPGDEWLATVAGAPLFRPLARFAYNRFADLLFAWNRWMGHW